MLPVKNTVFRAHAANPAQVLTENIGSGNSNSNSNSPPLDAAHEARAVVESRFLSMKAHAAAIGLPTRPARILATGGGSTNQEMMQVGLAG